MQEHAVVSREQWLEARKALLSREKAQTRLRDEISAARRALPWVKIDKNYRFQTPDGEQGLAELFGDHQQLIIKHFMFAPEWTEGCIGCSFEVDHIEGALLHLPHHGISVVAVSRAPLAKLLEFRTRMGWHIDWVSSEGSDFNHDFGVSFTKEEMAAGKASYNYEETEVTIDELSGFSIFYRNEAGEIFHTYSTYGRGAEEVLSTYMLLDLTPMGRNETGPHHNLTDWVKLHDLYPADADRPAGAPENKTSDASSCCGH